MILLLLLCTTLDRLCSQTSAADCVLDIQFSTSFTNRSDCELHTWGGFINSCCGLDFDGYLYALGLHANQSGKIFSSSSEQESCLASMELLEKNITGCGVEKLTSGAGGCSDYTVMDVMENLGDKLRKLDEDCMPLSIDGRTNDCTACLRRWEEISATSNRKMDSESANIEANLCRFAVLISLTSIRFYDRESIQAVCECLGTYSLSVGEVQILILEFIILLAND